MPGSDCTARWCGSWRSAVPAPPARRRSASGCRSRSSRAGRTRRRRAARSARWGRRPVAPARAANAARTPSGTARSCPRTGPVPRRASLGPRAAWPRRRGRVDDARQARAVYSTSSPTLSHGRPQAGDMSYGHVDLRVYAELNDFLPPESRGHTVRRPFRAHQTVKDVIEAAGVPHTEVDLVLVNGEPVDFSHRPTTGDRLAAYPVFETLDIGPINRLRPRPLREVRFVVDVHLGRLARLLRLLGFDTRWANDLDDATLAAIGQAEHRIVLTRDRGLLKRRRVTHGLFVRSELPVVRPRLLARIPPRAARQARGSDPGRAPPLRNRADRAVRPAYAWEFGGRPPAQQLGSPAALTTVSQENVPLRKS